MTFGRSPISSRGPRRPAAWTPTDVSVGGFANDVANPRDDRRPAQLLEQLEPGEIAAGPGHFTGGNVESVDKDRDIGADRRQIVTFKLQSVRGDIAQHRGPEILAAFDMC